MKQKIYLFVLAFVLATPSFSQKLRSLVSFQQQQKLTQLSKQYLRQAKNDKKTALELAKIHHWPTLKISKNGNLKSLQGLDAYGRPKYYTTFNNTIAAGTTRTNSFYLNGSLGINLNGSSSFMDGKLGIWDGGLIKTDHQELNSRVVIKDATTLSDLHATHVAGTMIATGINPIARGMAWGAKQLQAYDFDFDFSEMATAANNLLVSNHSYGVDAGWVLYDDNDTERWEWLGIPGQAEDANFGLYGADAAKLDEICFNAPYYLPVFAAGNSRNYNGPNVGEPYYAYPNNSETAVFMGNRPAGISSNDSYDIITGMQCAKNTLCVGAVRALPNGAINPSDIIISNFSSWGPTDDGRIKPDLVGNGVNVTSCSDKNTTAYDTFSGTSMASPNVCGSLLLLQEYYAQLNGGRFMQSATLKGLALHTTDEAGSSPGPDYIFGWGLLNMERAGNTIKKNGTTTLILEKNLANGSTFTKNFTSSASEPVKVSICWTDFEGDILPSGVVDNRKANLINDLDIKLVETSNTFLPWKLDPNNPSNAATKGNNLVDNIEQINTGQQAIGDRAFTVTVSHKGQLFNNSQNYSLIISGIKAGTLPIELVNFTAQKLNNGVFLKWQTLSEKNTKQFEIQRSSDGINFTTIGTKPTAGNSSSTLNYYFNDLTPQIGLNYYLIKSIDADGNVYHTDMQTVVYELANDNEIVIFPNPVKDEFNLSWDKKNKPLIRVNIFTIDGKKLQSFENSPNQNFKISVSNLPIGVYLLEIQDKNTNGRLGIKKLIKQ
ncbi:MAG: T9SS C-terminal target domain-containing protein [Sphingobacteriales bacterium]|nr:MAG: T9SS C-terminal target domain-containing protein [Sphingobacteriales bacterium]